ncbi:hypothetical protein RBSWK_03957 [Rhodopirellula baltica SWK14]|uniref:Uncharacterized protein n=1 Tax=Rhodopirellula baltica SWK14 TaxID=993516 RepID=L7CE15_RHOBT|nr:hypothetical protein RBSWK_03957 [Rhodopirellula baltica SWK14]
MIETKNRKTAVKTLTLQTLTAPPRQRRSDLTSTVTTDENWSAIECGEAFF